MIVTIQNEELTVCVNSLGSELVSVKDKNATEFIYQPTDLWIGQAKNLFPNVGESVEDFILINGKKFPSYKHGFAKDMEFELHYHDEISISFVLNSNYEIKKMLPYEFSFFIHFKLEGNKLYQTYEVKNHGADVMYFGVGAHTGFFTDEIVILILVKMKV